MQFSCRLLLSTECLPRPALGLHLRSTGAQMWKSCVGIWHLWQHLDAKEAEPVLWRTKERKELQEDLFLQTISTHPGKARTKHKVSLLIRGSVLLFHVTLLLLYCYRQTWLFGIELATVLIFQMNWGWRTCITYPKLVRWWRWNLNSRQNVGRSYVDNYHVIQPG